MPYDFEFDGIDWQGRGYFGVPVPPDAIGFPDDPLAQPWRAWAVALREAKAGNFSYLPALLQAYEKSNDSFDALLDQLILNLIGEAGPSSMFSPVEHRAKHGPTVRQAIAACGSLWKRGMLSDASIILDLYERVMGAEGSVMLPIFLSDMLDDDETEIVPPRRADDLEKYREEVTARVEQLERRLGRSEVLVLRGEVFSVPRLARLTLNEVKAGPNPRISWRARFEASTGLDCTAFYKEGSAQPLAAAAIIEEFLEGPASRKYENGVRYFFSHRIPD
jgi:hypothetical protein